MSEGYDLMYSLHTDASEDPEVQGSTLYGDINPKNANHELFEAITEAIEEATGFETKGVRYRENSTYAEYKVYKLSLIHILRGLPGQKNLMLTGVYQEIQRAMK